MNEIEKPNLPWYEIMKKEGRILELPLGRDADIYHVYRSKSKFGKIIWTARKVSYEHMAYCIAQKGNDFLWCNGYKEALDCRARMAKIFGGTIK